MAERDEVFVSRVGRQATDVEVRLAEPWLVGARDVTRCLGNGSVARQARTWAAAWHGNQVKATKSLIYQAPTKTCTKYIRNSTLSDMNTPQAVS